MELITSGGSNLITIPQGQKIAISADNATGIVYYSTFPVSPELYYESSRVTNGSVILGSFDLDKHIRIDVIGAGTLSYDVGLHPAIPSDSPFTIPIPNGSGSPYEITAIQTGSYFTNEGASAKAYLTLPEASQGIIFNFIVSDSDGMRISAQTGDTIRIYSDVAPSGGYIECTDIGSTVSIKAINAIEWIVVSSSGTWTPST